MRLRATLLATTLLLGAVAPAAAQQDRGAVEDPAGDLRASGEPALLTGPQARAIDLVAATAAVDGGGLRATGTVAGQLADRRVDEESGTFAVLWQGADPASPSGVWVFGLTDAGRQHVAFWEDAEGGGYTEQCDDWSAVEDGDTVTYSIAWTCIPGVDTAQALHWQLLAGTGDGAGTSWSDEAPDSTDDGTPVSGPPLDVPASAAQARPTPTARDIADTCDGREPRQRFDDVEGNPHQRTIECLSHHGITEGTGNGNYSPTFPLSKGQTAKFLVRTLGVAGVSLQPAGDACDDDGAHADALEQLVANGILDAPGDRNCGEIDAISRAEMADWVEGALALGGVATSEVRDWYVDDEGHVHELAINDITTLGVVTGAGDARFLPAATLSRAQMATFLARTLDALFDQQGA